MNALVPHCNVQKSVRLWTNTNCSLLSVCACWIVCLCTHLKCCYAWHWDVTSHEWGKFVSGGWSVVWISYHNSTSLTCYINLSFLWTYSCIVFWDVMPCSLVGSCQCLRGAATFIFNLKVEARDSSEMLVTFCEIKQCQIQQDTNLYVHYHKNLKAHILTQFW
jgi:hypothetical protein